MGRDEGTHLEEVIALSHISEGGPKEEDLLSA